MLAGIRTRDLRKVYTSPPPLASGGGFGFGSARSRKNKQPKAEIVALDGHRVDLPQRPRLLTQVSHAYEEGEQISTRHSL